MSKPVGDKPLTVQPRQAWWKLLMEYGFVLCLIVYNVSYVLNQIATHPEVQAPAWAKQLCVWLTVPATALWALFLLWAGKSIWRRLRQEYQSR